LASTANAAGQARLTLVLGGARSGKSRYALNLAMTSPPPWVYIATAEALDEEMRSRIAEHKAARGQEWSTIEAPIDLAAALTSAPASAPVVVDCLTLWLSNLMIGHHEIDEAVANFEEALHRRSAPIILVSNEVGLGVVPETSLGRAFRDRAGSLHQRLAAKAESVVFMVAGVPMMVKDLS
jgi:adenosyl cobinamide kinase/adenosyl cobinamide phosphate guanylyltransferase